MIPLEEGGCTSGACTLVKVLSCAAAGSIVRAPDQTRYVLTADHCLRSKPSPVMHVSHAACLGCSFTHQKPQR